jgi:hypothetical protein
MEHRAKRGSEAVYRIVCGSSRLAGQWDSSLILVVSGTGRLWFQGIDRQLGRSETRKLGSVGSRSVGRLRRGTVGQRDSETVNSGTMVIVGQWCHT